MLFMYTFFDQPETSVSASVISLLKYTLCLPLEDIYHVERTCLRLAENEMYNPIVHPPFHSCPGWFCWNSQLTLANKVRITQIINTFRNTEAERVKNMNELIWHWSLEQEAIRASDSCSRKYLEQYDVRRNIEGLGFSLLCENGCMSERLTQNPSQLFFINVLGELLENNRLQDFDENGNFRRGNALYFGCALVIRNVITEEELFEDIYHFTCIFCTVENEMKSIYKKTGDDAPECPSLTVYGGDNEHPLLCHPKSLHNIFICMPDNPCPRSLRTKPHWWEPDPGKDTELIMLETETGPVLLVNETRIGPINTAGYPSSIIANLGFDEDGYYIGILSHYPPIPKAVYSYSLRQLKFYDDAMRSLGQYAMKVIEPEISKSPIKYVPGEAIEETEDAWCCSFIFVLSCIPTLVLAILMLYTCKKVVSTDAK